MLKFDPVGTPPPRILLLVRTMGVENCCVCSEAYNDVRLDTISLTQQTMWVKDCSVSSNGLLNVLQKYQKFCTQPHHMQDVQAST